MASTRATARQQQTPLSDERERQKQAAARTAAELVRDGMRLGLGSGTTVAHLLPAIAARGLEGVRCAATSPATEAAALALGLVVEPLDELGELDLAIDGADEIAPSGWLIKGGGGAHTREKIVAASARSFVVIASAEKAVEELTPPVPLELVAFGVQRTLACVGDARLREAPPTPDGGLLADYLAPVGDPAELAAHLESLPGVVEHGLFAPQMVSLVLIADEQRVRRVRGAKRGSAELA
ncbi:MAG TPA: ribose 5-phosphate isomerase A [Solirubrobacteraceae bacterium]|nr:ribose 5-phosphate isomerase A [Solirubrobacteraceae bacterium]